MLATSLITACSSDDIGSSTEDVLATTQTESSSVSVSDEGYLVFPTAQSLQNFVEQYSKDNANASVSLKAPRNTRAVGGVKFESVADLSERLDNSRHKTRANNTEDDFEGLDELEEMTEDEFNVMKAENLVV